MGYRIFYSYQSDIDSKLNQKFIREAINIAISKITEFTIEPLIEGFYGVGGNAPLAKTMFDQSKNSDIFIGDVTFTSSKIWKSNAINFHEDAQSYLMEFKKPINLKPAPNPNVLLETGYSWALKSHNRTILVMNKAFGEPHDLPVDMDGLRWPILYNLDVERASKPSKFKKELDKLSEALKFAIIDSIKSDISYQMSKLAPFENHNRWSRLHTFPLLLTPRFKDKLVKLRDSIVNYSNPIRITGLDSTGKSRLAFEIFLKNDDLDFDPLNETVLYYDLRGTTYNDINRAVTYLINHDQPKIVILDNCPIDIHKKLSAQFKGYNLKLITINTVKSNLDIDEATIFIEEEISLEINQKIVEDKYRSVGKAIDFDISHYKLDKTISIFENNLGNDINNKTSIELLKLIIGEDQIQKGGFQFLQIVSLFGFLGVSNRHEKELKTIKSIFFDDNLNDQNIEVLLIKKLLIQKGDFILSNGFEDELIQNWWFENKLNFNHIIEKLEGTGLLVKFISRLQNLLKDESLTELKEFLFSAESILVNNVFTDTIEGSELLNKLVNEYPIEVLSLLTKKIE